MAKKSKNTKEKEKQAINEQLENKGNLKVDRRNFLKMGFAGATLTGLGVAGSAKSLAANAVSKSANKAIVKTENDFPNEIREDYKPHVQWQTAHHHGFFGNPLRAAGVEVDPELADKIGPQFLKQNNYGYDNSKKGYDQLSKAIMSGGWALSNATVGPSPGAVPDYGLFSWEQPKDKSPVALMDTNFVQKEQYQFESKKQAADAIKRAAKLYGASLVGIAKQNDKWDFAKFFNPVPPMGRKMFPMPPTPEQMEEMQKNPYTPDKWIYGWDKFPFKPKTVIVMAFEMDYEGISTSPTEIAAGAVSDGYSQMAKSAFQLSVFLKTLGYYSVAAGNDLGLSVPYAIEAGLGEGSRMGLLVTYKYGPRVRLAKVYTDFDFVEYDKPKTFGVMDFCKSCKRCADACPPKAIPFDDDPTFEPTYDKSEGRHEFNAIGIKKYHGNAKKCFEQWANNHTDCANCISSCPYNKPDFWHHRLVDSMTAAMPGPVHDFMREMDKLFGYGNVDDKGAVNKFFSSKGKSYDGF